jgi:hypothetical protein
MQGKELLQKHSLKAELGGENCLVCQSYQYREGGERVICLRKSRVDTFVGGWSEQDWIRCRKRAGQCQDFEDMRPAL